MQTLQIFLIYGILQFSQAVSPLTEYIEVLGHYVAPVPANSLKIEKDLSLDMCAAKCTLEFRMKTFPCYAFEYTPGSRMCVHTNITSLVVGGGYLGLKKNPAVNYYERTKAEYSNLFHGQKNTALQDQKAYFAIKFNTTLEQCAFQCASSQEKTCMSYSYSSRTGACGLSSVFYNNGKNHVTLLPNQLYTHYQYYTSWPCNATMPENYGPHALASIHFPYQSIQHTNCHVIIKAPKGKQVKIVFPTVYFGANVCSQPDLGVTVSDGSLSSSTELSRLCYTNADRSHPPTFTSNHGSLYIHYKAGVDSLAFQSVYSFVEVDPCVGNSCQQGSTCRRIHDNSSYVCDCLPGFTGRYCETNIDDCQSSPCYFNGQCIDKVNGYICNCTDEFTGNRCQTFTGACAKKPCQHGSCVITSRYNYTCRCDDGFVGHNCDQAITPCMHNPCLHGVCHDTQTGSYECQCNTGYHGKNCDQISFDVCSLSPCKHGTCSSRGLQFTCTCLRGYTGQLCETLLDPCYSINCNHGRCVHSQSSYGCQCQRGYRGQYCDEEIPICQRVDCGDGHCYPYPQIALGYVCYCADSVYRRYCNGSTSTTQITPVPTPRDVCKNSPCQHGQCNVTHSGYVCHCQRGYKGINCDVATCDVADCGLGLCLDKDTGYECVCPIGYEGTNCQSRLTTPTMVTVNCSVSPCLNGGTCVNLGGMCACKVGFVGSRCEIHDACRNNPCKNGTCQNSGQGYRCVLQSLTGSSNTTASFKYFA